MSRPLPAGARVRMRWARVIAILGATLLTVWVSAYAIVAYALLPMGSASPALARALLDHEAVVYLHVFCASLAPVAGLMQLSPHLRRRWPRAHRWIGRFYLGVCVLVGGVAGVWLAVLSVGGMVARLGFGVLGVTWLATGAIALARICDGDIDGHRAWMCRNYALTWGAVFLRIYMGVAQELLGLSFERAYPLVAWLAWVPNVLAVEWMMARPRLLRPTR